MDCIYIALIYIYMKCFTLPHSHTHVHTLTPVSRWSGAVGLIGVLLRDTWALGGSQGSNQQPFQLPDKPFYLLSHGQHKASELGSQSCTVGAFHTHTHTHTHTHYPSIISDQQMDCSLIIVHCSNTTCFPYRKGKGGRINCHLRVIFCVLSWQTRKNNVSR